ncbi:hypothetical protein CYMTET_41147 [Cymbomonas tetramitiformis]|uniref:Uncharacterized protein n=1 Tax=Cymbomonas tetramitiformis TaxID=36881 RepID=A0AAE0C6Q2_9CHLO|nr:hypothetical protein CYMTET_41147 [Cymbomonas tetramitiformis]
MWREDKVVKVKSSSVVPDATNRDRTGLSLEHVHFIATLMSQNGFQKRVGNQGHDIPVLVRETCESDQGKRSLEKWRRLTKEVVGFPIVEVPKEYFCSLGNGHFTQALNLFRTEATSIFSGQKFKIAEDKDLREALECGVESIVLSRDMPWQDRKFISEMLNRTHDGVTWLVEKNGAITIKKAEFDKKTPQWEALSKVCDAEQLSCLIRSKLGVDYAQAERGYLAKSKL